MAPLSRSIIQLFLLFFFLLILGKAVVAQEGPTICASNDPLNCIVRADPIDTLQAVVIYAARSSANVALPSWHQSLWNPDSQISVSRYYKDISGGRYLITAATFGKDGQNCFNSTAACFEGYLCLPFVNTIMGQADDSINFADFDNDGPNGIPASQDDCDTGSCMDDGFVGDDDGCVDAFFFIALLTPHTGTGAACRIDWATNDQAVSGRTITICQVKSVLMHASAINRNQALTLCAHEWGHPLFGSADEYGDQGETRWGFGAFSLMGEVGGFPEGRTVPPDPFKRHNVVGWDTAIEVTTPLYQVSIPDYLTTGIIYKLTAADGSYYFVTNYRGGKAPRLPCCLLAREVWRFRAFDLEGRRGSTYRVGPRKVGYG